MSEEWLLSSTALLAGKATELATNLRAAQGTCNHESTSVDVSSVADELGLLSTTLWHVNRAISTMFGQYTKTFETDLNDITKELDATFDEISECCAAMRKADSTVAAVPWFFKQSHVRKLHKHLEALKTTLIVMRIVLGHGADNESGRTVPIHEDERSYKMHKERSLIEAYAATKRDAIADLHKLEEATRDNRKPREYKLNGEVFDSTDYDMRHCHKDVPTKDDPVNDIPVEHLIKHAPAIPDPDESVQLRRRFSSRGVRLSESMSHLDLGAHGAPDTLKEKWVGQAKTPRKKPQGGLGCDPVEYAEWEEEHEAELAAKREAKRARKRSRTTSETGKKEQILLNSDGALASSPVGGDGTPEISRVTSKFRERSLSLRNSSVGQQMRAVVRKLSGIKLSKHEGAEQVGEHGNADDLNCVFENEENEEIKEKITS